MIFLSYSRRELYFTESIVFHLQKKHFDIWYDNQQLTPGVRWRTKLHEALHQCDGMILIASQASMRSPYVREEWQHMLDYDKPIIVVACEYVQLPATLQQKAVAILDFRQHYDQKLRQLVGVLFGEQAGPVDPLHPPGLLQRLALRHLEPDVGFMHVFLLFGTLSFFVMTLGLMTMFWDNPSGSLLCLSPFILAAAGFLFAFVGFVRRNLSQTMLNWIRFWGRFGIALGGLGFILSAAVLAIERLVSAFDTGQWVGTIVLLPLAAMSIFYAWLFFRSGASLTSPAIYRWLSRGTLSLKSRMRANDVGMQEYEIFGPGYGRYSLMDGRIAPTYYVCYHVHYAPRGRHFARILCHELGARGHRHVDLDESPDYLLVIVSPDVDLDALAHVHFDRLLPIVTHSIDLKQMPQIMDYQIVDFRGRSWPTLHAIVDYLGAPDQTEQFAMWIQPANFDRKVYPSVFGQIRLWLKVSPLRDVIYRLENLSGKEKVETTGCVMLTIQLLIMGSCGLTLLWMVVTSYLQGR